MASGMSCLLPGEEVSRLVLIADDLHDVRFRSETEQFQNLGGRLRAGSIEAADRMFEAPGSS